MLKISKRMGSRYDIRYEPPYVRALRLIPEGILSSGVCHVLGLVTPFHNGTSCRSPCSSLYHHLFLHVHGHVHGGTSKIS